jgi:ribosomal protein S14
MHECKCNTKFTTIIKHSYKDNRKATKMNIEYEKHKHRREDTKCGTGKGVIIDNYNSKNKFRQYSTQI